MIGEILGPLTGAVIVGYQSLFETFGSPYVMLAMSATLIALAAIELRVRRRAMPAEVS